MALRSTKNRLSEALRSTLNEVVWVSLLFAAAGALIALRYLTGLPNERAWQSVYVFGAAAGVFFVGHFVLQLLLVLPLTRLSPKAARAGTFALTFALLVALVTDTFVYQQYHFHINWAMIDLALVGGRDVFSFSTGMMLRIAFFGGVPGPVGRRARLGRCSFEEPGRRRMALSGGVGGVCGRQWCSRLCRQKSVTVLKERIPLYFPIRGNRLLAKFGLEPVVQDTVKLGEVVGSFKYPLNTLTYGKGSGLNVLILAIDSLRADVVDAKTMPNLTAFKQKALAFEDHYSGGNATRAGIFSLFYGLPPFYWDSALASNVPSAMVSGFQSAGYDVTAFTTATLLRPEFYATVFAGVPNLRMGSTKGNGVAARDVESVDDFEKWLTTKDPNKKFLSFMFLDSAHALDFPADLDVPYKDYWETVDRLRLSPDFDPKPFLNRYKNSAYWQDVLIGRVLGILKKTGRLKDTIVIVTADHGEEFNDSKLNYWGHNGNFSKAQIKVPLVVYWPGMESQTVDYRTTAYDVSTTLMKRVLNVQNPTQDYSVGRDLFETTPRDVFYAGSYNEDAMVAGDDVLLVKISGAMEGHKLDDWRETETGPLKALVPDYLKMRGKYRQ